MRDTIIEVKHIAKKFDEFSAVSDISFSVKENEIIGLLGPNGAGKTTTIQMLLGVLEPTGGEINYFGKNLRTHREEILEKVNFSSTYTNLPGRLTIRENLTFISYLYDIKNRKERVNAMIEIFKLQDLEKKSFGQLSAGQKTRVNLAKAFINNPKVLLLDEPTASMDPDIAIYIRDVILQQKKEHAMSILWTSHNMAEVEELCDRVVFINHGKVIANDTPAMLAKSIQTAHVEFFVTKGLEKLKIICQKQQLPYTVKKYTIRIDMTEAIIADFLQELAKKQIIYTEISIDKPSLEDYFLEEAQK